MSVVRQPPKLTNLDEVELRAFYASCGMSAETTENAIKARRSRPTNDELLSALRKKKHGRQNVRA